MSSMNQLSATLAPMLEPGETIRTWRSVVGEPKTSAPTFATDLALLGPAAFNAAATGTMAATGSIPAGTNLVVVTDRRLLWCSRQRLGGGITVLGVDRLSVVRFIEAAPARIALAKLHVGLHDGRVVRFDLPSDNRLDEFTSAIDATLPQPLAA